MNHAGHRNRLRRKFQEGARLEKHELLELLLFYAIPRRNTNDIAHELLDEHGSLRDVLHAESSALCNTEGIGENSALFLRLVGSIVDTCLQESAPKTVMLNSPDALRVYLISLFVGDPSEKVFALYFNSAGRLLAKQCVAVGSLCAVNLPVRDIAKKATERRATSVILAHNHPGGMAKPSGEDVIATKSLRGVLNPLGILLVDHIIVSGEECTSIFEYEKAMKQIETGSQK